MEFKFIQHVCPLGMVEFEQKPPSSYASSECIFDKYRMFSQDKKRKRVSGACHISRGAIYYVPGMMEQAKFAIYVNTALQTAQDWLQIFFVCTCKSKRYRNFQSLQSIKSTTYLKHAELHSNTLHLIQMTLRIKTSAIFYSRMCRTSYAINGNSLKTNNFSHKTLSLAEFEMGTSPK